MPNRGQGLTLTENACVSQAFYFVTGGSTRVGVTCNRWCSSESVIRVVFYTLLRDTVMCNGSGISNLVLQRCLLCNSAL
jgi:hypothetical protein